MLLHLIFFYSQSPPKFPLMSDNFLPSRRAWVSWGLRSPLLSLPPAAIPRASGPRAGGPAARKVMAVFWHCCVESIQWGWPRIHSFTMFWGCFMRILDDCLQTGLFKTCESMGIVDFNTFIWPTELLCIFDYISCSVFEDFQIFWGSFTCASIDDPVTRSNSQMA